MSTPIQSAKSLDQLREDLLLAQSALRTRRDELSEAIVQEREARHAVTDASEALRRAEIAVERARSEAYQYADAMIQARQS